VSAQISNSDSIKPIEGVVISNSIQKKPINISKGPNGVPIYIYFDFDDYEIKIEYKELLNEHAIFLKANPNSKIAIESHTESKPGSEYNMALAQKRADKIRNYLKDLKVPEVQMEAVSFGSVKSDLFLDKNPLINNRMGIVFLIYQ
jgi:outer membrane protein OmpA-like peptidoglycan-associated protein